MLYGTPQSTRLGRTSRRRNVQDELYLSCAKMSTQSRYQLTQLHRYLA